MIGRKMAIVGLLVSIYLCFELKKPSDPGSENQLIEIFNENHTHEYFLKVFGPNIQHYTIHQVCKYLKDVCW